ncbi:MAG: hypothetical protein M1821_000756 [Bathelium mastoideum]|nr:MAG: hypothetical protein M1821_000756 [Bathelium mastoideum]
MAFKYMKDGETHRVHSTECLKVRWGMRPNADIPRPNPDFYSQLDSLESQIYVDDLPIHAVIDRRFIAHDDQGKLKICTQLKNLPEPEREERGEGRAAAKARNALGKESRGFEI